MQGMQGRTDSAAYINNFWVRDIESLDYLNRQIDYTLVVGNLSPGDGCKILRRCFVKLPLFNNCVPALWLTGQVGIDAPHHLLHTVTQHILLQGFDFPATCQYIGWIKTVFAFG